METKKLTVRLPAAHLEFARNYAREHHITVNELFDRHLRALRAEAAELHPEVERIRGLIQPTVDARAEYGQYLEEKHRAKR